MGFFSPGKRGMGQGCRAGGRSTKRNRRTDKLAAPVAPQVVKLRRKNARPEFHHEDNEPAARRPGRACSRTCGARGSVVRRGHADHLATRLSASASRRPKPSEIGRTRTVGPIIRVVASSGAAVSWEEKIGNESL